MTPPNGRPSRAEDLVDLGAGTGSGRVPPAIPSLKKKEKDEKKGSGIAAGGGRAGGSTGGGSFLSRLFGMGEGEGASVVGRGGATAVRGGLLGGAKMGFWPMMVNFLASNFAAVLLTGLVTGGAVYTLYSLGMNAMAEKPGKTSVFPSEERPKDAAAGAEARADASGLSYFQSANQGGAFTDPGVSAPKDAAGDKPADAPQGEVKKDDKGAPTDQPGAGNGPQLADALAKGLEKPKMVASRGMPGGLGAGNGLAGGAGMAGGMMQKFLPKTDDKKGAPLQSMKRDTNAKLASRNLSAVRNAKGGAYQQLKVSNGLSRQALGQTSSEGESFKAAEAFNTAPAIQGAHAIASPNGLGDGGGGVGSSANPDGGPIGGNPADKPAPSTGQGQNQTPYNNALMMAEALLMTASTIITVIGILALIKNMPIIGIIAEMWQKILYGIAIGMAASAAAIGAMVSSQYGQKDQGLMVTIGGTITSATAAASLMSEQPWTAWVAVLGGIAGIGSSIGALLLPMMKGNSMNNGGGSGSSGG